MSEKVPKNRIIQLQEAVDDYKIYLQQVNDYYQKYLKNQEESIQIELSHYLLQVLKSRDKVEEILQSLEYPSPKEIEEIKKLDGKFKNFRDSIKDKKIITRVKNYSRNSQEIHKNRYLRDWWWKDFYDKPLDIQLNYPANVVTSVCIFSIVVIIFRNLDIVSSFGFDFNEIFKVSASSIGVLLFSATFFGNFRKYSKNLLTIIGIKDKWHDEAVGIFSLFFLVIIICLFIFNMPSLGIQALNKGDELLKENKYIQAERQYQKALTYLNPENSKEQNRIEKIRQYFSLSFTQEKHPLILFKLGQVYYQKLDLDKAQKYYQKALLLETNKDSVFYMEYLNNLAKVIILKSYEFPSILPEDTDSQSSDKEDTVDKNTAKFLLDLSMSISSNRTTKLFCQKLSDNKKKSCLNQNIFQDIFGKNADDIIHYQPQYNDINLYNYESQILNQEKKEQELEQQSEQEKKLFELRLKYITSFETGKFNYGLYEFLNFKDIKESKDIQENQSLKNKLKLAQQHFRKSSVYGAIQIMGKELDKKQVDGTVEEELKFEDNAPNKVKEMKSLCFYRLSQFMEKTLSEEYIQKKEEMKTEKYRQEIEKAKNTMEQAKKEMNEAKKTEYQAKKENFDRRKAEYQAIKDPLRYLEEEMVGSRCYTQNNLPLDTLDFYEQRIVYNFRRIPGFPKNPNY